MNIIGTIKRITKKEESKPKKTLREFKEEQKELALNLRKQKAILKEAFRKYNGGDEEAKPWNEEYKKFRMKYDFRHRHIAYCLLRGTEMEKIEKPAESNKPNKRMIEKIMEEYLNENVCNGEK